MKVFNSTKDYTKLHNLISKIITDTVLEKLLCYATMHRNFFAFGNVFDSWSKNWNLQIKNIRNMVSHIWPAIAYDCEW